MLRRTKVEKAADVKLPPLEITTQFLDLSEHEMDFYECIYKQTNSKFNTYVAKGTLMHNYAHIFELLSKLRQAVDHPYLITCSDSHLESAIVAQQGVCVCLHACCEHVFFLLKQKSHQDEESVVETDPKEESSGGNSEATKRRQKNTPKVRDVCGLCGVNKRTPKPQ
jgi:hypothetical protein